MKKILKEVIKIVISILFLIVHLYPIVLIFMSAVKTKVEMAKNPFGLPKDITLEYFIEAAKRMSYLQSTFNSASIVIVAVVVILVIASMAAYAISRKGKKYNIVYFLFLAGLLVPFQMTMIPLYKFLLGFNLINKLGGVMCVYIATLAPFSIFLLTGFVKSLPRDLEEAAYIDGSGVFRTFFSIIFPLLKGPLATVAVLNTFTIWNDFLMPMLYLQSKNKLTLTVTLSNFQGMYFSDWSMIFAGVCLIVAPMLVVYLFAQRFIISGITAGAVKG